MCPDWKCNLGISCGLSPEVDFQRGWTNDESPCLIRADPVLPCLQIGFLVKPTRLLLKSIPLLEGFVKSYASNLCLVESMFFFREIPACAVGNPIGFVGDILMFGLLQILWVGYLLESKYGHGKCPVLIGKSFTINGHRQWGGSIVRLDCQKVATV